MVEEHKKYYRRRISINVIWSLVVTEGRMRYGCQVYIDEHAANLAHDAEVESLGIC